MFVDKSLDVSESFSGHWSAELLMTQDMTGTVSGCFQPTFKK
jgi:hypothetical protein